MRIAVDARQMYRPERRGIGKTLVPLYAALAARRPDWTFTLVHQLPAAVPELDRVANVRRVRLDPPGAGRLDLWERALLPAAAWAGRADVLHAPANTGPARSATPVVLTLHDLIPLELAPADPAAVRWAGRAGRAARRAAHVLTGSEYSKRQLVEVLGLPADKVTVTPWAPAPDLARVTDPAELGRVRKLYGVPAGERYVFGFGADDPRKNTARLIRAFAGLPAAVQTCARLVLVGVQPAALPGFRAAAADGGVGDRVVVTGFAAEADLPALLSGAAVLAFPSLAEGFGLPLLDAFVCGAAVLTGDRSSLPEVAGDAAVLVDPTADGPVRDGLHALLTDDNLRATLVRRGFARAAGFSWPAAADATAAVFERAAG